jgi:hypothetical protein
MNRRCKDGFACHPGFEAVAVSRTPSQTTTFVSRTWAALFEAWFDEGETKLPPSEWILLSKIAAFVVDHRATGIATDNAAVGDEAHRCFRA